MVFRRFRLVVLTVCLLADALLAQQQSAPSQSARQALVEMFSGSEEKLRKHLTLRMQDKLGEMTKENPAGNMDLVRAFTARKVPGTQKFDAFDFGPILFALNDSAQNSRLEVHIDADEPLGREEENILVSLHSFRAGIEQELPLGVRFMFNLKAEEGIWRLNAVTFSARIPVGDPRILDPSWWNPQTMNLAALSGVPAPAAAPASTSLDLPKMAPFRAVRMIGLAENLYARQHPEVGYTCGITNLVNVGKGLDDGELYKFMDPEFADGVYNGYRYSLIGCQGKPARTFQVTAEPLNGSGKAYCSDDRHNLRASDDGKALTCLIQGKIARQ